MFGKGNNQSGGKGNYWVDSYGNQWWGDNGGYGYGKGAGKTGKAGNKSKTGLAQGNGKGGNGGNSQTEKPDRQPTAYFFDLFPDKTKGEKWLKCPKSGCFGCILASSTKKECKFCKTEFNRGKSGSPIGEPGNARSRESSGGRNTPRSQGPAQSTPLKMSYLEALTQAEAGGMTKDGAETYLKNLGYVQPQVTPPKEGQQYIQTGNAIGKLNNEIANLEKDINQKNVQTVKMSNDLDALLAKVANLKTTVEEKRQKLEEARTQHLEQIGIANVMLKTVAAHASTSPSDSFKIQEISHELMEHSDQIAHDTLMKLNDLITGCLANTEMQTQQITQMQTTISEQAQTIGTLQEQIAATSQVPSLPEPTQQSASSTSEQGNRPKAKVTATPKAIAQASITVAKGGKEQAFPEIEEVEDGIDDEFPRFDDETFTDKNKKEGATTATEADLDVSNVIQKRARQKERVNANVNAVKPLAPFTHPTTFETLANDN